MNYISIKVDPLNGITTFIMRTGSMITENLKDIDGNNVPTGWTGGWASP
jgi:hypothetical protein